eukprot:maker-scaffold_28-snap-gene-4.93-mRNA-1 protein AED:0.22 eAED:0.22 QI:42/1/1/1/0.4/0.16/6/553/64
MMKSIKKQYEERDNKTSFNIEWDFYDDKAPNTKDMFKREIEEFVKVFQPDKEVSTLEYTIFFYL